MLAFQTRETSFPGLRRALSWYTQAGAGVHHTRILDVCGDTCLYSSAETPELQELTPQAGDRSLNRVIDVNLPEVLMKDPALLCRLPTSIEGIRAGEKENHQRKAVVRKPRRSGSVSFLANQLHTVVGCARMHLPGQILDVLTIGRSCHHPPR